MGPIRVVAAVVDLITWEKATGKDARLESGATYDAVKSPRLSVPGSAAAPA
jgi:hypothetical protein